MCVYIYIYVLPTSIYWIYLPYSYIYHDDVSYNYISKKTIYALRLRISHWGQVLEPVLRWTFRRPQRIPRAAAPCCASRSNVRSHAELRGMAFSVNPWKTLGKSWENSWENMGKWEIIGKIIGTIGIIWGFNGI